MAFDAAWERTHAERSWGKYPQIELVRWATKHLQLANTVLDLGSGQGASSWYLAREGYDPVQVDGSYQALVKSRERLEHEQLEFTGVKCDLNRLPFASHAFDAAIDIVSVAHNNMADFSKILKEVARVLKPGGKLFSMIPTNRCSRRTFKGYQTSFFERDEIEWHMERHFRNIEILSSSYQLAPDCMIENWVVTGANRQA